MREHDLEGRRFAITGANTGIGRATAEALARRGATLRLLCRSEARARPVCDAIADETGTDVRFVACDLGDLDSVRSAADAVLAEDAPLHVLINNAGLASQRGQTASGFELAFGVNHVGHYLLTRLLLDHLRASGPARIVNVASKAHFSADGIDWDAVREPTKSLTGMDEYGVSKLANVLFTRELARRLEALDAPVTTYSLHPGVVGSEIWRRIPWPFDWIAKRFMITEEEGAQTTLYCATSPDVADESGLYYDECTVYKPSKVARDDALATELWTRSAAWTDVPVELDA